jgi:hypothetical protein
MPINPVKISIIALVVAVLSFLATMASLLLGPGLLFRVQEYFHSRDVKEQQQLKDLQAAA